MPRIRTIPPAGAAALVAAVGWLLSGVLRATLTGPAADPGALRELLVPATGGSLVHSGVPRLVLAGVAGAAVVAVVVALLTSAVLRPAAGGRTTVVLACWFAAVVGALLGQLVSAALGPGPVGTDLWSALWTGPYWGVVYGWVVGLVAVAVLQRSGTPLARPTVAPARAAALVAGLVAAPCWALVGLGHRAAADALGPGRGTGTRVASALLPNTSTDYLQGSTARVALAFVAAALVVGAVVAAVTWLAGRSAEPARGRLAFVLAAWLGAVLASSVGPTITALGHTAPVLTVVAAVVPTSALWGLLYGWLVALAALAVLVRDARTATPAASVRVPAHRA